MIAIMCVDLNNGILFNNRRQSRDRAVRDNILNLIDKKKLWMNEYSSRQFNEQNDNIFVDEKYMDKAEIGEYCFVEDNIPKNRNVESFILYRWDKKYPCDSKLNINFSEWMLVQKLEFEGNSHGKIVREIYEKGEK